MGALWDTVRGCWELAEARKALPWPYASQEGEGPGPRKVCVDQGAWTEPASGTLQAQTRVPGPTDAVISNQAPEMLARGGWKWLGLSVCGGAWPCAEGTHYGQAFFWGKADSSCK